MSFAQYSVSGSVISAAITARISAALCAALLIAGCAAPQSTGDARGHPRIDRLSEEQAARLAHPTPRLTVDDLLRMTRDGQTPQQIIERLRAGATRLSLSSAQCRELESQGLSKQVLDWIATAEERARQTDIIDAQVRWETAEANQRKNMEAREAREWQQALRYRGYDPFYADPFDPWIGPPWFVPPWPGYWGWRWNHAPRNGMGIFWRGH